jgi:hypothetical protein
MESFVPFYHRRSGLAMGDKMLDLKRLFYFFPRWLYLTQRLTFS